MARNKWSLHEICSKLSKLNKEEWWRFVSDKRNMSKFAYKAVIFSLFNTYKKIKGAEDWGWNNIVLSDEDRIELRDRVLQTYPDAINYLAKGGDWKNNVGKFIFLETLLPKTTAYANPPDEEDWASKWQDLNLTKYWKLGRLRYKRDKFSAQRHFLRCYLTEQLKNTKLDKYYTKHHTNKIVCAVNHPKV